MIIYPVSFWNLTPECFPFKTLNSLGRDSVSNWSVSRTVNISKQNCKIWCSCKWSRKCNGGKLWAKLSSASLLTVEVLSQVASIAVLKKEKTRKSFRHWILELLNLALTHLTRPYLPPWWDTRNLLLPACKSRWDCTLSVGVHDCWKPDY